MNRIFTILIGALIFTSTSLVKVNAQNSCSYWQERDSSFSYVPFSYCTSECTADAPPYYRCDDAATSAIVLPFTFCFWGQNETTIYINENGNITFPPNGANFTTFTPDTFPQSSIPPMIAPFWGDVDCFGGGSFGGGDAVIYKITPHYVIVQWDSVGFFNEHTGKLNSFQVILTDGTSPIIPIGNNVSFAYRQMQWTTGDASGGSGGFGGSPATVGANEGDGVRFIQIGLFDNGTSTYVGQFPPGPNYDGVAWLDNQAFVFNLCAGTVAPLLSGVSPCDTFKLCLGDSVLIPLYFFSPIQGDSVWSNLLPPIPPGVSIVSNNPGHTDSLIIKVVGTSSDYGYTTVNFYGYDNASPQDTTFSSFVIEVDSAPTHIVVHARMDTICAGDTSNLTVSGGVSYYWSTGATVSSITVTPPSTQVYTVGVSDGGCTKDTTIKVVVMPIPTPSIVVKPDSVCPNDSALLIGDGGGSYIWSTGQTSDSIWVVPSTTTTYTLFASNGFCSGSITATVKARSNISAFATIRDSVICPFDTSYLSVTSSGANVTYTWSNGATTSAITVIDSVTTIYTVAVHGACNTVILSKTVKVIPLPKPEISGKTWECHFIKDTLKVVNITGDSTTYLWSNGSTKTSYITGEVDADSTVSVVAYNSLGCSDTTSFVITSRAVPDITINRPAPACSGLPVEIVAKATGTGPFTFSWSPGGATTDSISVASPADSTTVTYTCTVTNGCPASKIVEVTAEIPVLYTVGTQTVTIETDTAILWASGNSTPPYHWQDSLETPCLDPPNCDTVRVTPTVTTTYSVTGKDKAGCEVTGYITVVVDFPCLNFTVPNVFTPNYEGSNGHDNEFYIKTEFLDGWSILIFDRWGKEMYKSTNQNQYWTGTNENGDMAPDGVYYYVITGTCQNTTYKKEGFVQLIR
jgi:gliding motility-associated-like protein